MMFDILNNAKFIMHYEKKLFELTDLKQLAANFQRKSMTNLLTTVEFVNDILSLVSGVRFQTNCFESWRLIQCSLRVFGG